MKILVTGGLGFMGYHLVRFLLEQNKNCSIQVVDNLSSTKTDYQHFENLIDVEIQDLKDFSPDRNYDRIYHLASPVGSLGILSKGGQIALDILELANKASDLPINKNGRILYVSSSEIYGQDGAHSESDSQSVPNQRGPRMEYALGKLSAEHMMINKCRKASIDIRIVRPFNAMGPYQSEELGFVIPRFFKAALNNEDITVYGDGHQKRSFCEISDIVSGIYFAMEKGHPYEIYNVGNDENIISIKDLAYKVKSIANSKSKVIYVNPKEIHGQNYLEAFEKIPNLNKISQLGWKAKYDLHTALENYSKNLVFKKQYV